MKVSGVRVRNRQSPSIAATTPNPSIPLIARNVDFIPPPVEPRGALRDVLTRFCPSWASASLMDFFPLDGRPDSHFLEQRSICSFLVRRTPTNAHVSTA